MRQKFFTNTIQSKFIKNLLLNTSLPICNSCRDGDYLINGFTYLYNTYLIKCTKSGVLGASQTYMLGDVDCNGILDQNDVELLRNYTTKHDIFDEKQKFLADVNQDGSIDVRDLILLRQTIEGYHEPIYVEYPEKAEIQILDKNFIFGKTHIRNTEIFESPINSYDSDTHKYLGEYLRFYRDIFKTDLMPFYNCFNGAYTSKFYIDDKTNIVKQNNYDYYQQGSSKFNDRYHTRENYKILEIPIKFNKEYTIALDCNAEVLIAPCFINHGQLISVEYNGEKRDLTLEFNSIYNSIFKFTNLRFNSPKVIIVKNNNQTQVTDTSLTFEQLFQRYERYLTLLIQLPADNSSSVIVLEGNYTRIPKGYNDSYYDKNMRLINTYAISNNIFSVEDIDEISDSELDKLCLSNLSLLNINDSYRYPYSDRLVEYLLWNVIDNNDDIGNNVIKIQNKLNVNTKIHYGGYYDKYLRALVFNLYKNNNRYTNLDINGYTDKNVEAFLSN